MRSISIILTRDFKEIRQSNAFRVIVIVSAVIAIAGAVIASVLLCRQVWLGEESARPFLELIMALITYFVPLIILIFFIWTFAGLPITREKINGNIECLLATPLSPAALWIGKCLAVFLPGFAVSVIATLVVVLSVNLTAINPATGYFVMPAPVLVTGFIINPLLFFGLLAFIVIFSLVNNPDIAIAPSFLIGFGLMMGIPLGVTTGVIDLTSWTFALWYLVGTVVIWVVVCYISRTLSRESIVLSSKGA